VLACTDYTNLRGRGAYNTAARTRAAEVYSIMWTGTNPSGYQRRPDDTEMR